MRIAKGCKRRDAVNNRSTERVAASLRSTKIGWGGNDKPNERNNNDTPFAIEAVSTQGRGEWAGLPLVAYVARLPKTMRLRPLIAAHWTNDRKRMIAEWKGKHRQREIKSKNFSPSLTFVCRRLPHKKSPVILSKAGVFVRSRVKSALVYVDAAIGGDRCSAWVKSEMVDTLSSDNKMDKIVTDKILAKVIY